MKNKTVEFLFDKRGITLSQWAKNNDISPTSVRNAFYNNKVMEKVAIALKNDRELYSELSDNDITQKYNNDNSSLTGNNKSVTVYQDLSGITINVTTTDGKFNEDDFVEQLERGMRRLASEKLDTDMSDVA